jgi:CheY-like chemotaxis protein
MDANILVVDDEPVIADLLEVYLKSEGCTVFTCGTAAEALTCVRDNRLDLAILDVMLPDMSGFTLCGEIRREHRFPVLMLTAKVGDMDKIMGLTIGADDYITKPFNPWSWWPGSRPSSGGTPATMGRTRRKATSSTSTGWSLTEALTSAGSMTRN